MVGGSAARSARAGRGDWRRLFGEYNPARDIASAIQFHGGGDDDGPRDVGRVRRAHLTYSRSHGRGDFPQVSRCASAFRITGRSRSFVPRGSVFQRSLSAAAWRGSVCWWIGQDADRRSPRGRDHESLELERQGLDARGGFERAFVLPESRATQGGQLLRLCRRGRNRSRSWFRNARAFYRAELVRSGGVAFRVRMVA